MGPSTLQTRYFSTLLIVVIIQCHSYRFGSLLLFSPFPLLFSLLPPPFRPQFHSNRRYFEAFAFPLLLSKLLSECGPEHAFLALSLKTTLMNISSGLSSGYGSSGGSGVQGGSKKGVRSGRKVGAENFNDEHDGSDPDHGRKMAKQSSFSSQSSLRSNYSSASAASSKLSSVASAASVKPSSASASDNLQITKSRSRNDLNKR